MKKYKKRIIRAFVAVLSLSLSIPLTHAANPLIQNITYSPTPFYFNLSGKKSILAIEYDFNTGLTGTAPITEQILDDQNNIVYEFGAIGADQKGSGHYRLEWDGTYKNGSSKEGQLVPDGKYKIYLIALTPNPPAALYISPLFDAGKVTAAVLIMSNPPPAFYLTNNSADLSLNYHLVKGSAQVVAVGLKLFGPTNNNPSEQIIATNLHLADGDYSLKWNGLFGRRPVAPGNYNWSLFALSSINDNSIDGTTLNGALKIRNPDAPLPAFNSLTVKPNPFDLKNGSVSFGYTLNNTLGYNTVTAGIYRAADLNNPVRSWSFTNQLNGVYNVSWDGADAGSKQVTEGNYNFKVSGLDTAYVSKTANKEVGIAIESQQISFVITNTAATPPQTAPAPSATSGFSSSSTGIEIPKSGSSITANPNTSAVSAQTTVPSSAIPSATALEAQSQLSSYDTCADFKDIDNDDPDCEAVKFVKNSGAITGSGDGKFAPTNLLQRDQIAKITLEIFKKFDKKTDYCRGVKPFFDIAADNWAYQYICQAKNLGIVTGYKTGPDIGYYRAGRFLNRAELLTIILRNLNEKMPRFREESSFEDVEAGQWYDSFAQFAFEKALFIGTKFHPSKPVKRIEAARILYKLHQLGKI